MTDEPNAARRSAGERGPGRPVSGDTPSGRESLLQAARELMAERGLPRVTLREVADRAGVKPALVSYYFGSKQGLLDAVIEAVASQIRDQLASAVAIEGSAEDRLLGLIQTWVRVVSADPYVPRLLMEQVLFGEPASIDDFVERFARPNLDAVRSLLCSGAEAGEFRGDVDPLFFTPALAGCSIFFFLAAPIVTRLFGVSEISPEMSAAYAEQAGRLLTRGIVSERGDS